MTECKTKPGPLSILRKPDAGNVPAPWVPPELPGSSAAPGGAVAKRDGSRSLPAPWVPAELPATNSAPAATTDREITKLKPWVPPVAAPRNLPAVSEDGGGGKTVALEAAEHLPAAPAQNTGGAAGPITINIVNQVEAPAPVYVSPWWGWWGGCPRAFCPHRYGRTCWRFWCW